MRAIALGRAWARLGSARFGGGWLSGEHLVDIAEFHAEPLEADLHLGWLGEGFAAADGDELGLGLAAVFLDFLCELLAGAGDSVAFAVDELLDAEGEFDIAAAIEALARATLVGFKLGKLALPEAQDIGRDIAQACDLANAEVQLVRDVRRRGVTADWLVVSHLQTWTFPRNPDLNTKPQTTINDMIPG